MAEFLTTSGTIADIERLIVDAKTSLVFISPYVQISDTIHQRMLDASKRKVTMTFVYGKGDMKSDEYDALAKIPGLNLFYFEHLHAKCYYNESKMIITSMNLYAYSSKNREMGILLDSKSDQELFEKAVNEADSIIRHSVPKNNQKANNNLEKPDKHPQLNSTINQSNYETSSKKDKNQPLSVHSNKGNCIRCSSSIDFDPLKPYCNKCYKSWSQLENANYVEKLCHGCSTPTETTLVKPLCFKCYKRLSN